MITCFPVATLNMFVNTGSQLADVLNEQTPFRNTGPRSDACSTSWWPEGRGVGCDPAFCIIHRSLQTGVMLANAWAVKDANLASCATVAGVCWTHSRCRWSPQEQHQIISSIYNGVPEGSHQPLTDTLEGEDATNTLPMMQGKAVLYLLNPVQCCRDTLSPGRSWSVG